MLHIGIGTLIGVAGAVFHMRHEAVALCLGAILTHEANDHMTGGETYASNLFDVVITALPTVLIVWRF